MISGKACIF